MIDQDVTNVVLDGGCAATLEGPGVRCVDVDVDWVLDRPEDVAATHARFASVGADILLTDTARMFPHLDDDWGEAADAAVALAQAGADRAVVWGTIGPVSMPGKPWSDTDLNERTWLTSRWVALAERFLEAGVKGFAIHRFTDPSECATAVAALHATVGNLPIAAGLCPRDDGRLIDGSDPANAVRTLRHKGATWVGFDCGTGPASIEAAVAFAPDADWAKPSRGGLDDEDLIGALVRLAGKCRFIGGCCGVGPDVIDALHRVTHMPLQLRRGARLR